MVTVIKLKYIYKFTIDLVMLWKVDTIYKLSTANN